MYNIAPSLSNNLFTKRSPRDYFRGFVSSAWNFSKCSEQIWLWLSLSKFAFLIRTSHHSLKSSSFSKGSWWKLIPLLESLGILFEHPTTAHSTILIGADVVFLKLVRFGQCKQWRHAVRPSLQHGFQNGRCSNCPVMELFAVTVTLKGKFAS